MRLHFLALLAMSTALVTAAPAFAQNAAPIVLSNTPGKAMTELSTAKPSGASGWEIQAANIPTAYRLDGRPVPCTITSHAPNGSVLRMSGGDGKLTGIAVDVPTLNLPVMATINAALLLDQARVPVNVLGYVSSPTSVIMNTMKYPALYGVVATSKTLRLQLGEKEGSVQISYSLNGVQTALNDMEACYKQTNQAPAAANAARDESQIAPDSVGVPMVPNKAAAGREPSLKVSNEYFVPGKAPVPEGVAPPLAEREILPVKPPQEIVSQPAVRRGVPAKPKISVRDEKIVDTFRAHKGESLRNVMRRWAERAGIDLVWVIPNDMDLKKDYSFVGTFQDTLPKLLADYPESGIKTTFAQPETDIGAKPFVAESQPPAVPPVPVMGEDLSDFIPSAPPVSAAVTVVGAPTPVAFGPAKRWRALQGASMREVMKAWSDDAGVALIWRAPQDYVVRTSINMTSDYGKAVHMLLDQYMAQPGRPTGQIFQDPTTGAKSLVILPAAG